MAEIAASSAAIDLGAKKRVYRRNGVREYLVWQVFDQRLDWFQLDAEEYVSLSPDQEVICSQVFPRLWLDRSALLTGNMPQVLSVLQAGLQSEQHQAFVQQLTQF